MGLDERLEHEKICDRLVVRLQQSGRYDWIEKHIEYDKKKLHGEADVVAGTGNNVHYYEVKCRYNESSFYKANKQFKRFKKCADIIDIKFIYVTPQRVIRVRL